MASLFFEDYQFPSELYNQETGDFTTPIRTLLDFAPHILQELPKNAKEQQPMNSTAEDSWTKNFVSTSYFGSLLTSERTKAITEFIIRCGNAYMEKTSNKKYEEERFKEFERQYKRERRKRQRENNRGWFFNRSHEEESSSSSESEEEEIEQKFKSEMKNKRKADMKEEQQVVGPSTTAETLAKSAAAAGVLSLSLYSTYQATVNFSEVSFHNQLEILISQVQSILQSTEIWIQEHDKMQDAIPEQIRSDVIGLKQLLDLLVRLDPRSRKKLEATGWSVGAFGGLSALGGVAFGSTAVVTGGAALAIGGAIVMISSKASGKSQLGARLLLENQVRERVASCQRAIKEREMIIRKELANKKKKNNLGIGEKRKLKQENVSSRTTRYNLQSEEAPEETSTFVQSPRRKKEKIALPN